MDIKSATYLKNHSDELLDFVNQTRKAIIITQNDKARAVIQDYSTYEKCQQTFLLLKFIAGGEKDYREGKLIPHLEVKKQIEDKLNKLQEENT